MTETMQVAVVPLLKPPSEPVAMPRPRGDLQERVNSLQRQVDRLRAVEQQMAALGHLGSWEIETATGRATWSDAIQHLVGISPGEPLALEQVLALFPAEAAKAMSRALRDLRHGGPGMDLTLPYATAAGRAGWLRVLGQAERGAASVVGIMRDVTREHDTDQQLLQAARHDSLTGLGNRGLLIEQLRGAAGQEGFALLLIDIDQLGEVNASYGQASGDQLLLEAARLLRPGLQPGELVCRVGGHTFALMIARDIGPEQALARAHQVMTQISGPLRLDSAVVVLSARIGVASHPSDATEAVDLLHDAGIALAQAKAQPGERVRLFRLPASGTPEGRLGVVAGLRQGLRRVELELFYQPIVDLDTRAVRGVEGLIRWHHPTRGLLRPAAFEAGLHDPLLATEIGEFVLEHGLQQMRRWLDAGVPIGSLNLNVSEGQLRRGDLVEQVAAALQRQRLEPWRLRIEVLENTLLEHEPERILDTLSGLQALGVLNALDDFGTGYASLAHLRRFNVNHIKIDRSFIQNICLDPRDAAITRGVIGLARSLGIRMTAEGIEDAQQLAMLRAAGCSCGQGYLFAHPMPAEEMPGFLARWDAGDSEAVFGGLARAG